MGSSIKLKRRALPANYIYKTAADYLRWRKAQIILKKQMTEEKIVQSVRISAKAAMVWEDDGGAPLTG